MHKIPKFFRRAKTQEGDSVVSSTKQILSPEELEKLKNKIKTEISTAEIRIQYILNKTTRPNERDPKEIENLENDIKNVRAKYAELIDPTVTIYKTKKRAVEQTDQATSQGPDKPNQPNAAPASPRTVT
jgi:septum formation topological specificity factor MinE